MSLHGGGACACMPRGAHAHTQACVHAGWHTRTDMLTRVHTRKIYCHPMWSLVAVLSAFAEMNTRKRGGELRG